MLAKDHILACINTVNAQPLYNFEDYKIHRVHSLSYINGLAKLVEYLRLQILNKIACE